MKEEEEEEDNDDDEEKASDGKIKKNIWRQFLTHIDSIVVVVVVSRRRNETFSDVLWSFINITQPHQTMYELSELTRQRNCAYTFTRSFIEFVQVFGWQTEFSTQLVLSDQNWSELSNC